MPCSPSVSIFRTPPFSLSTPVAPYRRAAAPFPSRWKTTRGTPIPSRGRACPAPTVNQWSTGTPVAPVVQSKANAGFWRGRTSFEHDKDGGKRSGAGHLSGFLAGDSRPRRGPGYSTQPGYRSDSAVLVDAWLGHAGDPQHGLEAFLSGARSSVSPFPATATAGSEGHAGKRLLVHPH